MKSVIEAIEELAAICMLNGMKPPEVMIFDKESLIKLGLYLRPIEKDAEGRGLFTVSTVHTCAGPIRIEEAK